MKQTRQGSGRLLNNAKNPWAGHLPVTRAALEPILAKAANGKVVTLLHELVLVSVCEFRAKTANGELGPFLRGNTVRKLYEARFALNEIGAMDIAALISVAIAGFQRAYSRRREATLLLRLERDLLAAGRQIDKAIAHYAVDMQRGCFSAHATRYID
jgi:hypothetical protein